MTDISPSAFAELQNDVSHVKKTLDQLANDVRPLLLARSGDLAAVASIQRDIAAAHEKHREAGRRFAEIDARVDKLERRLDRAQYLVIGAMAVIQILWGVFGPALLRAFGLGG